MVAKARPIPYGIIYLMKLFTLQLVSILFLTGCASKDLYNNIQSNGKRECEGEPPARYDECMAQYDEVYGSYKTSRDRLLKDSEEKRL